MTANIIPYEKNFITLMCLGSYNSNRPSCFRLLEASRPFGYDVKDHPGEELRCSDRGCFQVRVSRLQIGLAHFASNAWQIISCTAVSARIGLLIY